MASLRKLFRLRASTSHEATRSTTERLGSNTPEAVCKGLVEVREVGRATSWRWMWLELHEEQAHCASLALCEAGYKEGPEHLLESLKVDHVERVPHKHCCLLVEAKGATRKLYLRFSAEWDLYFWLEEIYSRCPTSGVVNYDTFQHNLHVRQDERRGSLTGFPNSMTQFFEKSMNGSDPSISSLQSVDPFTSQSSVDTNLPTPKSTLPVNDFDIIVEDDIEIPKVHLPPDHIGYTPIPRSTTDDSRKQLSPKSNVLSIGSSSSFVTSRWPNVRDLTRDIERLNAYPVASGGYSDIYQGRLNNQGTVRLVGLKAIRAMTSSKVLEQKLTKRLNSEVDVWQRLHHPNIVELLGLCRGFGQRPALVSWWYENGHIMDYLENLGDEASVGRRLKLLLDVAKGLAYLHAFASPVLHGDLKGANVLVDKRGSAMLTDFGLSSIFESLVGSACLSGSGAFGCSVRWMAVELVCSMGEDSRSLRFTPATDVYSFGSTMLEVLTGKVPYHECQRDVQVIMEIYQGTRHRREDTQIELPLWKVMENCWMDIPSHRSQSSNLVQQIEYHYLRTMRMQRQPPFRQ